MNPQLETIKKEALVVNDQLNTVATAEGLVNGVFNADRVYTKRNGNHVELTT